MAAVQVTSANINNMTNAGRTLVRTSAGIPYVVLVDATDGGIEVWKGNATTPTSFAEQNAAGNPQTSNYGSVSAAIDSSNIIHIAYMYYNGKASQCRYVTFATSSDTFSGDTTINSDIGGDPTALSNLYTAIAIDANDIPHVVYSEYPNKGGLPSLYYNNRIGAAWNASGVEIEGGTNVKNCKNYDIAIDLNNVPIVSYTNASDGDLTVALGNNNDATSFTLYDVDTSVSGVGTSICIDSSGNHYVGYGQYNTGDTKTYPAIAKHNYADGWTTWQSSVVSTSDMHTIGGNGSVSLSVVSNDLYIFYENINHDICYNKYSGTWGSGTWKGETLLETGTFNTVKTKWGFWVDNGKAGVLSTNIFAGKDPSGVGSEAFSSSYTTLAGNSFHGSNSKIYGVKFKANKTNSPTGDITAYIYSHTGSWGNGTPNSVLATATTYPAASLTGTAKEVTLVFTTPYSISSGTDYFIIIGFSGGSSSNLVGIITDNAQSWVGNYLWYSSGSWNSGSSVMLDVKLYGSSSRSSATEIDYVFSDEVSTSEDVWWNTLSLAQSQIKKFMGVAQASLKKVIGVTNATMKKLEGVANT